MSDLHSQLRRLRWAPAELTLCPSLPPESLKYHIHNGPYYFHWSLLHDEENITVMYMWKYFLPVMWFFLVSLIFVLIFIVPLKLFEDSSTALPLISLIEFLSYIKKTNYRLHIYICFAISIVYPSIYHLFYLSSINHLSHLFYFFCHLSIIYLIYFIYPSSYMYIYSVSLSSLFMSVSIP